MSMMLSAARVMDGSPQPPADPGQFPRQFATKAGYGRVSSKGKQGKSSVLP